MASSTWCWNSKPVLWRILKRRPKLLNSMLHTSDYDPLPTYIFKSLKLHDSFAFPSQTLGLASKLPSIAKISSCSCNYTGTCHYTRAQRLIPWEAELEHILILLKAKKGNNRADVYLQALPLYLRSHVYTVCYRFFEKNPLN